MKPTQIQLEAKLFKGFADQSRLLILSTIVDGPKTVTEIVEKTVPAQHFGAFVVPFGVRPYPKGKERTRGFL